jgi:hypothetical protein
LFLIFITLNGLISFKARFILKQSTKPHKFINIVAKWPGSSHDSRVFKESAVHRNLENNNIDGYLLGDSVYACNLQHFLPVL